MERETRSSCVARHPRSNCNIIYNTGNILNSIIPVLYQSIVTCMHEFNYAIVLRIILYPRYQQFPAGQRGRVLWNSGRPELSVNKVSAVRLS